MQSYAPKLSELLLHRAALRNTLRDLAAQVEARKLELAPLEGWPGKNAEERALSQSRTLANDQTYKTLVDAQRNFENQLETCEAQVYAIEKQAREQEWFIRARTIDTAEELKLAVNPAQPETIQDAQQDESLDSIWFPPEPDYQSVDDIAF